MDELKIKPLPSNKDGIKINDYMEQGIIPRHPCSFMMVGRSGMGKSNLLVNLLTNPKMYGGFFDIIFLISETADFGGDGIYTDHLAKDIPKKNMFRPDVEGIEQLKHIDTQKGLIKKNGITKSPKILIISDDVAHAPKYLSSKEFLLLHIANRHLNISIFTLTQSYVKVPRSCRAQVSAIVFFHGATDSEKIRLSQEHTPSGYTEKEFLSIVNHATAKKYDFLFINKFTPMRVRYRQGLSTILTLNRVPEES
jgi:hypothetical protein